MPPSPIDHVQATLHRITEWANTSSVPLVYGEPASVPGLPMVAIDTSDDLLEACSALVPKLLVVRTDVLTEADLEVEIAEARGASDRHRVSALEALRSRVGHLTYLGIWAISSGYPVLVYATSPEWYDAINDPDPEDDLDDHGETAFHREQRERKYWTSVRRAAVAKEAANDPRFPQAKTEAARVIIVRDLLKDKAPESDYIVKEIAREARGIFDLQAKPRRQP